MTSVAFDELPLVEGTEQQFNSARVATARVLHLINGEHYSGAERVQDLLALRLPKFGFEVGFACVKPGKFLEARQAKDAPLYDLAMGSRLDLRPAFRLARLVKREGYSLIHTHTPRSIVIGRAAAAIAGVPLVHHVHSPTLTDSTRQLSNRVNALSERVCLRGAAAVISVSGSMGRYAASQGVPNNKLHVVPNGVAVRGPLPNRSVPRETWTLGTVALFRPRKGLEVLLESLAILRERGAKVRLLAVGGFETADYETEIRRRANELRLDDVIEWTGFTQDVPSQLSRMDLFALPSLFGEGLPMVVLEAMASGIPVIGTQVEGVPEAIRDEREGVIVAPRDPAALAEGIERMIRGQLDWAELRTAAHRRQAEKFSDQSMAAGVAEVYRRVLGQ